MRTRTPAERKAKKDARHYVKTGEPVAPVTPRKRKHQAPKSPKQNRSTCLAKKGKVAKREEARDRAASAECKRLAQYECAMLGTGCGGHLEAHHVMECRHRATRWDQRNLVCLCKVHHDFYQNRKPEFDVWFKRHRPGVLEVIERLAWTGREPE